jgi:uncharacterized protein
MDPRARALIERLGLAPHREGGFYREHFRAREAVDPRDGRGLRAALTAIDFLLPAGQVSRWHAVASAELWTFHDGDPIRLLCVDPETLDVRETTLGRAGDGHAASFAVPARAWQAAEPAGAFGLVTCAVGPGFDFADFRLLRDDPAATARIETRLARFAHLL